MSGRLKGPSGGYLRGPGGGRARGTASSPVLEKALLTMADLTYVGAFRFPEPGSQQFAFSYATFAARRVGGSLRFYGLGNVGYPHLQKLYSFSYPGYAAGAFSGAPQASLIADFGQVWDGKRPVASDSGEGTTWGMYFDANGRLWWTYSTGYEGTSNNPVLSCTELDESLVSFVTKGPWRSTLHSGFFNGAMADAPAWWRSQFGVGFSHVQIPSVHNQNGTAPWGTTVIGFTPPDPDASADPVDNQAVQSIAHTKLAYYTISDPQGRVANVDLCGWSNPALAGPGGTPPSYYCDVGNANALGPTLGAQQWGCGGSLMDWVDTGTWIDTPTKSGIFMVGQWADAIPGFSYPNGDTRPHLWYGPSQCCHGHDGTPMYQATGPGCSSVVDYGFIVDPADLGAVVAGSKAFNAVNPSETFQLNAISGYGHSTKCDQLYKFGSAHYDPTSGLLFVSQRGAVDNGFGNGIPVMHVFEVAE